MTEIFTSQLNALATSLVAGLRGNRKVLAPAELESAQELHKQLVEEAARLEQELNKVRSAAASMMLTPHETPESLYHMVGAVRTYLDPKGSY